MLGIERTRGLGLLILLLLAAGGCGYHSTISPSSGWPTPSRTDGEAADFDARESPLGSPSQTRVSVVSLRNDSPEPWLDRILTDAMRREIGARGVFDFVDDPAAADLVIRGRIRPLDIRSKSFSRFVAALEYALTLRLDLEVVFSGGQIVRLDPKMLSESDVYLASADIEITRTNRLEVLRRLSDLLASRVADSIELMERPIPDVAEGEGG